jgi:disulfide bond formation protein DsbB
MADMVAIIKILALHVSFQQALLSVEHYHLWAWMSPELELDVTIVPKPEGGAKHDPKLG